LQKAGEVLGVDTSVAVDVATKNATLNGITHCSYFAGDAEGTIPELAKKTKYDSVCAVVTCCINNSYRSKWVVKIMYSVCY
jgi:ribosomal protein L11 methylase PrmA